MKWAVLAVLLLKPLTAVLAQNAYSERISLNGEWQLLLDSARNVGDLNTEIIGTDKPFPDSIVLPGTAFSCDSVPYCGRAWYKRKVTIPEAWADKDVIMHLGHTALSTLYIDGNLRAGDETLSLPQEYNLQKLLKPGTHWLTLRVDNDGLVKHNGFTEDLWLEAVSPVRFTDVQFLPVSSTKEFKVKLWIQGKIMERKRLLVTISSADDGKTVAKEMFIEPSEWDWYDANAVEVSLDVKEFGLWTPERPNVFNVEVELEGHDRRTTTSALVDEKADFMSGEETVILDETDVFGEKGTADWHSLLSSFRYRGKKVVECRHWCPGEEAFAVADEMGLFLCPMLPEVSKVSNPEWDLTRFLADERHLIVTRYAHHPSFRIR